MIVPSRGRPAAVGRMVGAWRATGAYTHAALLFIIDNDDPAAPAYHAQCGPGAGMMAVPAWQPMVTKLNLAATAPPAAAYRALGFMGDDHLPRTPGWTGRFAAELDRMGTGIVYGDDGLQGAALPTAWALTGNIVTALGAMVPAPVEHFYCDDAIRDLGRAAGCLQYLPEVLIEHMHATLGKAPWDDTYARNANPAQTARDRAAYQLWRDGGGLAAAAAAVRALPDRP